MPGSESASRPVEPAGALRPEMHAMPEETQADFVLERGKRLSQSSLWRFQRQFYDEKGPDAWSKRIVPTHVTSNAFIADAYARVVLGFLRDCAARPAGEAWSLDAGEPVYIVELGAGTGYFSYLFVTKLVELAARSPFAVPRFVHVITDFTDANVEFWASHPCFQPLIEYGLVDMARFDAERDTALELRHAGRRLDPGAAKNPVVAVANYVFDSLRQDVFRVHDGALHEGLAALRCEPPQADGSGDTAANAAVSGSAVLDHLEVDYTFEPVAGAPYGDPVLDSILDDYRRNLGNTTVPFPIGSLRALEHLEGIAAGRLLVLSADKGYTELHALTNLGSPHVVHHGSVSMMVNYHALGRYMAERGGFMLANSERHAALELVALGTAAPELVPETQDAFDRVMERFGPLDIYELTNAPLPQDASAEQLLALMRLSAWDPHTFVSLAPRLNDIVDEAPADTRRRIRRALHRVWEIYFPLPGGPDVPFELGFLHYRMDRFPESYYFYEESLRYHGEHPVTYHNMALCQYRLGQFRHALDLLERSLSLDPNYGPARGWRLRMLVELDSEPLLPQHPPAPERAESQADE